VTMSSIDRRHHHKPLFDVHPVTGASIEVFYTDRTLETFGRRGAGWFWWPRRRGFAPDGAARGPFPTSYSAYRDALGARNNPTQFGTRITTGGAGRAAQARLTMRNAAEEQNASEPARAAARAPAKSLQKRGRYQSLASTIGGEGGIRTHGTVSPIRRIQLQNSCASRDANCGHEIKLTESLAAPLREETRRRFQEQMRRKMPGLPPRSKHSRECGPLSLEP
jgi:hypothetical protein